MKRKINETQLEVILCSLILLSGLYTPIARNFIPVAGGGMSLIFCAYGTSVDCSFVYFYWNTHYRI